MIFFIRQDMKKVLEDPITYKPQPVYAQYKAGPVTREDVIRFIIHRIQKGD